MSKPKYLKPETIKRRLTELNQDYTNLIEQINDDYKQDLTILKTRCFHEWEECKQLNGDYTYTYWKRCKICKYENDRQVKPCQHDWRFLPDPSGNNDSEYVCDKCGKYSYKSS